MLFAYPLQWDFQRPLFGCVGTLRVVWVDPAGEKHVEYISLDSETEFEVIHAELMKLSEAIAADPW